MKKGNKWYFGTKAHIGVDVDSGVIHSLAPRTAKAHYSQVWHTLLHGAETSVWADKGYVSAEREKAFQGPSKIWGDMRKARTAVRCTRSKSKSTGSSPWFGPRLCIHSGRSGPSSVTCRDATAASPRTAPSHSRSPRSPTHSSCDGG